MSADQDVRHASAQFYAALNSMMKGDAAPLAAIWSHSADVTTMHPIGGRQVGWDQVRGSWEGVARIATEGHVTLDEQLLHVVGDLAYEVGVERGSLTIAGQHVNSFEDRVTNIYRREAGCWKIVHHHTDISARMQEILSTLPKA